jgi:hypothetical protein
MHIVTMDLVSRAAAELARGAESEDELRSRLNEITNDTRLTARLIDFIPEAFALGFIPHLPNGDSVALPTGFSVKDAHGHWRSVPFSREPIFALALQLGLSMYHNGPRDPFKAIVTRSATLDMVNRALNAGESIAGATIGNLSMLGVTAEFYAGSEGGEA